MELFWKFLPVEMAMLFHKSYPSFVGDGGNDVSMIQAADVGIGIVGKVSYL